jgi:hypothetical protein
MGAARYSRHTGYTIARRTRRPAVRTTGRRVRFGPTTAKFFALAVLAILAVLMLTQSGTNATTAYKQTSLRRETSQVDQDIQRLRLEATRAQSIQAIQQGALKDQMQPVQDGEVGHIEKGQVAGAATSKP